MDTKMYPLYNTLNKNIKSKKLTSKQKEKLIKFLSTENKKLYEAIIMIIAEHAKINDEFSIQQFSEDLKLPYDIVENSKSVKITLEKLPLELQQILWKFIESKI